MKTTYNSKTIEIKPNNDGQLSLYIWVFDSELPTLYQPFYPDTSPWGSENEALEWAKIWIDALEDADAPQPKSGPNDDSEVIQKI